MKAEYAKILSSRYKQMKDETLPFAVRQLYMFIYPQIYAAIKRGQTNVVLNNRPLQAAIDVLNKDNFVIYTAEEKTTIDWSGTITLYSRQRILPLQN